MEGSSNEIFHKMSKKVAQLTKVIFHLNTKNDEHDIYLKQIQAAHEAEIEGVLKSCNNKVSEAFNLFERVRQEQQNKEPLKDKYEQERQEAFRELENIKKFHVQKEQTNFKHWTDRVNNLSEELHELRNRCREQKEHFERLQNDAQAQHERDLVERSGKVDQIVETLSREKKALELRVTKLEAANLSIEKQSKQELSEETAKFGSQVEGLQRMLEEKDNDITRLNKQMAEKGADANALSQKLDETRHALDAERQKNAMSTAEVEERQTKINELLEQMEEKEATMSKNKADSSAELEELQKKLRSTERDLVTERSKALESQREYTKLKNETSMFTREKQDELDRVKDSKNVEKKRFDEQKERLEADFQEKMKIMDAEHRGELQRAEGERQKLQDEIKQRQEQIANLQKDIACLQEQQASNADMSKSELAEMQNKYAIASSELQEQIQQLKEAHSAERDNLLANHASALTHRIQEITTDYETKLEAFEKTRKEEAEQAKASQAQAVEEVNTRLTLEIESRTKALNEEREKERLAHDNLLQELQEKLETEQSQRRNLEDMGGNYVQEMQKLQETLKIKETVIQEGAANLKAAKDTTQILRRQIEDLESRHNSSMLRMKDDVEAEQREARTAKEDIINLQRDLTIIRGEKAELERSVKQRDETIESMESRLKDKEKGVEQLSNDSKQKIDMMQQQMSDQLQSAKEDAVKMVQELTEQHQNKLGEIYKKHGDEIENLKKKYSVEAQAKVEVVIQQREDVLRTQRTGFEQEMSELRREMETAREKAAQQFEAELLQARDRNKELQSDKKVLETRCAALENENKSSMHKIESLVAELEKSVECCKELDRRMRELERKTKEDLKILHDDHAAELSQVKASHEMEKRDLMKKHHEENLALKEEFDTCKRQLEETMAGLQERIAELQQMYENRPSRPEDVEQIRFLEREVRDREMAFNQLRDEMQFYKLELVNREQNYNKVFGATPTVGLVNPLANRRATTGSQPQGLPPLGKEKKGIPKKRPPSGGQRPTLDLGM